MISSTLTMIFSVASYLELPNPISIYCTSHFNQQMLSW